MAYPAASTEGTTAVLARAHEHLQDYHQALGHGPDSPTAITAAWHLHRDVDDLLPLAEQLLAERDQLADRLQIARRDPLTGLDTRLAWQARAEQMAAAGPIAVLFCDLDRFKPVNDRHGHAAGDAVLVATANRLADWCGPAGAPARLGGDEFTAAVPDTGDLDERVAKLHALLREPIDFRGRRFQVGASIGLARLGDQAVPTVSAAMEAADTAMYRAKGRGRRGRRLPNPLQVAHLRRAG